MHYAFCGLLLTACHKHVHQPSIPKLEVEHTVIAYIVAENSLSPYLNGDFRELIAGHSAIPQNAQLLVFIDDVREPRLYRLTADTDTVRLYTWTPDICSTDSASMSHVLDKVLEYSPRCERFDMVMSSHASGWIPQINRYRPQPPRRTFGIDNNLNSGSNTGTEMGIGTLANVIENRLGRVGFIFFDACYMQCIEVAHQLRHCADYIVASPTEIPGYGANYTHMMPCLFAADAPQRIVEQYYDDEASSSSPHSGVVISAIKTDETPALALAAQPIVQQLYGGRTTPNTQGVQTYGIYHSRTMYRPTYYDLLGLAMQTDDEPSLLAFRRQLERTVVSYRATRTWLTAFSSIFDARLTDITRTCGVTMFVPDERYEAQGWNTLYHNTSWFDAAGWASTGW